MPQFVKDGPEIPVELLTAAEEDRVVFFCGAGLSINAGLPDFRGLAKYCSQQLYAEGASEKIKNWLELNDPSDLKCSSCGKTASPSSVSWERFLGLLEDEFGKKMLSAK